MAKISIGRLFSAAALLVGISGGVVPTQAQTPAKPNILVIFGDDIGYWNISAYNRGMMGYRTPSIDRIAREGAIFTDYYGQQSCPACSRSASPALPRACRRRIRPSPTC
jgi:hypothetical protein